MAEVKCTAVGDTSKTSADASPSGLDFKTENSTEVAKKPNDRAKDSDASDIDDSVEDIASDSEANETPAAKNGQASKKRLHTEATDKVTALAPGKRQRNKVKRLSETWSDAHVQEVKEKKAKASEQQSKVLSSSGTALTEIPRIDVALRKTKPIDLKYLHAIIYGRPGSLPEIRPNIKRFCGFAFKTGSEEYDKKFNIIKQRSQSDLRSCLRLLSLEVGGAQTQRVSRLLDFLMHPSASMCKSKGKLNGDASGKTKKRKSSDSKEKKTRKPRAKKSTTTAASATNSSKQSSTGANSSSGEEDDEEEEEEKSNADDNSSISSIDSKEEEAVKTKQQIQQPAAKTKQIQQPVKTKQKIQPAATTKQPAKKRPRVIDDDEEDEDDDDAPLSSLTKPKPTLPNDSDLEKVVSEVLVHVDWEKDSLKVVREKVAARFPGVDLSSKKDFINSTAKDYLSKV